MATKITTSGIDDLERMLQKLGDQAQDVAAKGLYEGAGVIADAYTRGTKNVQTERFHYLARPDLTGTMRYASPEEKAAITGKSGISAFRKDTDSVETLVGFRDSAGYTQVAGKKKAVVLLVRSINSGTSFMHKQPVWRKEVTKSRKNAQEKIVTTAEKLIDEIINGK